MTQVEEGCGDDILSKVERLLEPFGTPHQPRAHYREISLGPGRTLSVDVFRSGLGRGHVRVHVRGRIIQPGTDPPNVPNTFVSGCPACAAAPRSFPTSYKGRGGRKYFGFQWHGAAVDLGAVEAAVRWLAGT